MRRRVMIKVSGVQTLSEIYGMLHTHMECAFNEHWESAYKCVGFDYTRIITRNRIICMFGYMFGAVDIWAARIFKRLAINIV